MNILNFGSIKVEEVESEPYIFWCPLIENAYPDQGRWWVSLRERIIKEAQKRGVHRFVFEVNGQTKYYPVPDDKELRRMRKEGFYTEEIKNYPTSPMKSYLFSVK